MATTPHQHYNRLYPGLVCNGIEFFVQNGHLRIMSNGQVKDFKDAPYAYHQILKEAIAAEPEVDALLKEWHPTSESKRLVQFGSCRFGGLDFTADVDEYKLQEGEYVDCPIRDMCPGNGTLCKMPKYQGQSLTYQEVTLIKLLATTDKNELIAVKLSMPLGSLHLLKKKLYEKLGNIQTKQEAVLIGRDLNII